MILTNRGLGRMPGKWVEQALCAQSDPDLWFPEKHEAGASTYADQARAAIRICRACPVQGECLEFALSNGEQEGIWGGVKPSRRRRIRTSRNVS